ncbi:MAG: NADH-quinone oxidoreductase subunit H [Bacillota bacterium]|nr:NADH-quinone oxidoreductase subunit H [Bacillota bacterium]
MTIFYILVFPGFLFLSAYGLAVEFVDRKLYARFQNRKGPPWFQPFADFVKLISKETIIPAEADRRMFKSLPVFAMTAVLTASLYIPVWSTQSLFPFEGDVIVILYLLTIPTLTFFLGGWHSSSLYSTLGSVRVLTQLFAYEVPLLMAILGPALLAGTWSLSGVSAFYAANPIYALVNIPGFVAAMIAAQGKLERVPFDIPEAETEIVAGAFTEYGGRLLALFRMTIDIEMVVVAALVSAIFIPLFSANPWLGFLFFVIKTLFVVFLLALFRSVMARLRIEQMVRFCWRVLTPLALVQILIDLIVKGFVQL